MKEINSIVLTGKVLELKDGGEILVQHKHFVVSVVVSNSFRYRELRQKIIIGDTIRLAGELNGYKESLFIETNTIGVYIHGNSNN